MSERITTSRHFTRVLRATLLCLVPVLLLGATWWAVDAFVLAPPRPTAASDPVAYVRYMEDPRGLPRLRGEALERFLQELLRRLSEDARFQSEFLIAIRSRPPDQQEALRENVFDAFRPRFDADVRRYHAAADDAAREAFLDDRIVYYTRIERMFRGKGDRASAAAALPDPKDTLALVMRKMSQEEIARGVAYLGAMAQRVNEINRDTNLKALIDARVAQGR